MRSPSDVIAAETIRVAGAVARTAAEAHARMLRASWLCLWLIARHALRVWIDSQ
jgi:hypothetical protein